MKIVIDRCKRCDCDGKRYIVNKKHYLCQDKNRERLQQNRGEKHSIKKPLRKRSKKQTVIELNYIKVCIEMDGKQDKICSGCGRHQGGDVRLSHSHIISRSDCKGIGKPQLIYDKNNITYHCMDFGTHKGCHLKWETGQGKHLLDYEGNLQYIRAVDERLYQRIKNKQNVKDI